MRASRIAPIALAAALSLTACKKHDPEPQPPANIATYTYTVRGQVERAPSATDARAVFMVHHEEIPEFVGPRGAVGMKAMVMEFPLAPGLSVADLKPGDKIELTFAVEFNTESREPSKYYATGFKPLDPSVKLDFSDRSAPAGKP